MYRFDSLEDYKKVTGQAYVRGLEEEKFTDFEAAALLAMFESISYNEGHIRGVVDAVQATGYGAKEARESVDMGADMIDILVEVSTKKLEELGLL